MTIMDLKQAYLLLLSMLHIMVVLHPDLDQTQFVLIYAFSSISEFLYVTRW